MKSLWILTAVLLACEGPVGPGGLTGLQGEQGLVGEQGLQGEEGEQGITGDQGAQGVPGVANIKVVIFSVVSSQWVSISDETYYFYKSISSITSDVSDLGAVLAYWRYSTVTPGKWRALPATIAWDFDDDWIVDYSEELTYIYETGVIWVYWYSSVPVDGPFLDRDFKVVIIPPAALAKGIPEDYLSEISE